jgi:hypothetical protein
MSVKSNVLAIPLTSFASASLSGTYQAINAGGLPQACFLLKLVSSSSTAVTVSYDGATAHDFILPNTTYEVNAQSNSQPNNWIANFQKGLTVYVAGTAGTGAIALIGYYQPEATTN